MDMKKTKKLLGMLAACYWILVIMVYLVAGKQFRYTDIVSDSLSPAAGIGEIVDGMEIRQRVSLDADRLDGIQMLVGTYGRLNEGMLHIVLEDTDGKELARKSVDVKAFLDGKYNEISFDEPIEGVAKEEMTLVLTTEGCSAGNAVTLYYGNTVTAGRFDIVQSISGEDLFTINGEAGLGKLCVKMDGVEYLTLYKTYWLIMPVVFLMLCAYAVHCWKGMLAGKNNLLAGITTVYTRYRFLLKQLVNRDFQTKYKRSMLGVAWSFLNPLFSMTVQYIVFSTLFRNDTPNYPVYLLTGIVFFNFFTEAVANGMTAITGNASLIKKVYMPKYIYPVSKILSSLINFSFALIPLFLVMLITGTPFRASLLLLVFDILCLLGFVMGGALKARRGAVVVLFCAALATFFYFERRRIDFSETLSEAIAVSVDASKAAQKDAPGDAPVVNAPNDDAEKAASPSVRPAFGVRIDDFDATKPAIGAEWSVPLTGELATTDVGFVLVKMSADDGTRAWKAISLSESGEKETEEGR